jgi:hypothetical protein
MRPLAATVLVSVMLIGSIAAAQDNMLRYLDLTTPDMTHAEMSRADIDGRAGVDRRGRREFRKRLDALLIGLAEGQAAE